MLPSRGYGGAEGLRGLAALLIAATVALGGGMVLAGCGIALTPAQAHPAAATAQPAAQAATAHPTTAPPGATQPAAQSDSATRPTTPLSGPATATLADRGVTPVAHFDPALPVTVTSFERSGNREVTVESAQRIVAVDMSGSVAATVVGLGLGDNLVGRDAAATIPGLEHVPVVTAPGHTLTPEAVLALKPTVVITDGSIGPSDAVAQVRDAGIPVVYVSNEPGFEGAQTLARQVGVALGVAVAGEALAVRIAAEVAQATTAVEALAPARPLRMAFLYLRGSAGVYYLFGAESGADELIRALGGVDAAAQAGISGMQPLADEAMIAVNPDVILVMTKGLESVGGIDGLVASRPAIALTPAGENRRIIDMADADILAFGPRSAAIVEALAHAIYQG